jgi:tetratricopeptide (TPR) repeat protein
MQHKWQYRLEVAAAWMVVVVLLCACSNEGIAFKKGEQSYAIGEYYAASIYYKKSYARCKPKERAKRAVRAFKMGECYRRIGYTQKAIAAYQNAVRYDTEDSTVFLNMARQQLKAGQYKQAAQNFTHFLEYEPGSELAHSGLLSCELGIL